MLRRGQTRRWGLTLAVLCGVCDAGAGRGAVAQGRVNPTVSKNPPLISLPGTTGQPGRPLNLRPAPGARVHVRVALDKTFYELGDTVSARVELDGLDPSAPTLGVYVVSHTGDVEAILVRKTAPRTYETAVTRAVLKRSRGVFVLHDGKLEANAGEVLSAVVMLPPSIAGAGSSIAGDMAIVGTSSNVLPRLIVNAEAQTADERAASSTASPFGSLAVRGSSQIDIALKEVLFVPRGPFTLQAFLDYSGGSVEGSMEPAASLANNKAPTYLVAVPTQRGRADRLPDLRAAFAVSANPRLRPHGFISTSETRGPVFTSSMQMTNAFGSPCAPGASPAACPLNVPALWSHMALWDLDTVEVPVAFLDQGFATASPDFRHPRSGAALVECDMAARPVRCAPGAANTPPTVGASLVGAPVWHGTGSVTVAGGVLNDGWMPGTGDATQAGGSAGTGGQVLIPMMYRFDLESYAFQMGAGMRRAVDDGAACMNVAAGYPCNVHLSIVGDFELCDPAARAAACALLTSSLFGAAGTACATATAVGGIPFVGAFLLPGLIETCNAATGAALASVPACAALVAIGDTRGPLQAGVDYSLEHGVPIIASMGNLIGAALPDVVRSFVDVTTTDGDAMKIVPATLRGVITVGAATSIGLGVPWANSQIRGASVAVWAPEFSSYLSPVPGTTSVPTGESGFTSLMMHSGTSAASSYVTGIVAAMQAANPSLNPRTPGLSAAARRAIPGMVRGHLVATATAMGPSGVEPTRLPMVNPLRAVLSAWGAAPAGFDPALNFNESGADDSSAGPRDVPPTSPPATLTGSIITVPGTGGASTARDQDFFRFAAGAGSARFIPEVTLTSRKRSASRAMDGSPRSG